MSEYNIEILCTCYTLDYLVMQVEALKNGTALKQIDGKIEIFEVLPDLTLEELNEAISRYHNEKYRLYREDWWTKSDREYDIQTLCTCYSLADLKNRKDEFLNNAAIYDDGPNRGGVLYTAEEDVINEAIASYNDEKYQRLRSEMAKERKQYNVI